MRGNGLTANSYTVVGDLDPRMTDAALHALAEAGIAAYVDTPVDPRGPLITEAPPAMPLDRLYVDATEHVRARAALHEILSEAEDVLASRIDDAWQALVAGFDTEPEDEFPRWPVAEDTEDTATSHGEQDTEDDEDEARHGRIVRRVSSLSDTGESVLVPPGTTAPEAPVVDGGYDHYIPPPPPPLPQLDAISRLAWLGALGGPALLMIMVIFQFTLPSPLPFLCVVAAIAGFITLVARMKDRGEDSDDGAVV